MAPRSNAQPGANAGEAARSATGLLTADDVRLFSEGAHVRLYEKLGARLARVGEVSGASFAVWAPNASDVSVIGDVNGWRPGAHPLRPIAESGVWSGFIPGIEHGALYKYHIAAPGRPRQVAKADPLGFHHETPPRTASIVWDLAYDWGDETWMKERRARNALDAPIAIYEVHLGSWMRAADEGNRSLSYRELVPRLAEYVERLGFSHVEFLPVMEHPFFGSWGYQTTGYFAPTSRYGTPQDLMHLIDFLHQRGIGVILDWTPAHFPTDEHGLGDFDGTHLYEYADPRKGFHQDWNSYIFDYGRNEVRSFLISSALFWLEKYHVDGVRVDAVTSMLYLDYSRRPGEWLPNEHGGNENLEAIRFLQQLNEAVYRDHPDVQTFAEESTAWPLVSRPSYLGGLGFGLKWDLGWTHDTLRYTSRDPTQRSSHHHELTFRSVNAYAENFLLPLSHDEVVRGQASLLARMPGDDRAQFANLRLLLCYLYTQPGKKLLFMGGEFGQRSEWNHDAGLEWQLLRQPPHAGLQRLVIDLNRLYREQAALHELDCGGGGFEWIDCNDAEQSTLAYLRRGRADGDRLLVACNFAPAPRHHYRIGVPEGGLWEELLNSDAANYGGSGLGNPDDGLKAAPLSHHERPHSLCLTLPPLAAVILRPNGSA